MTNVNHILNDGKQVKDIEGIRIRRADFEEVYRIIERLKGRMLDGELRTNQGSERYDHNDRHQR